MGDERRTSREHGDAGCDLAPLKPRRASHRRRMEYFARSSAHSEKSSTLQLVPPQVQLQLAGNIEASREARPKRRAGGAVVLECGYRENEPRSGSVPNVYWRTPSMEEMRSEGNFRGLPDSNVMKLDCIACAPFHRQDSDVWAALHSGRLTTSSLPGALGLYEKRSARKLGLPKHYASRSSALKAYHILREPPFIAEDAKPCSAALDFNAKEVGRYNDEVGIAEGNGCGDSSDEEREGERERRKARCAQVGAMGARSCHCSWGIAQEPAALFSLGQTFPGAEILEVGLCPLNLKKRVPYDWGLDKRLIPPMGASPDALMTISAEDEDFAALADSLGGLGDRIVGAGGSVLVAVEIKSVSPFREVQRQGKKKGKGSKKKKYCLIDAEPRDRVNLLHVPQVQMHMLATGAPFALYLSYSAGNGMKVYVVKENPFYQKLLLRLVLRFNRDFVLRGKKPPENFFFTEQEYQNFLGLTRKIAREAKLYRHVPPQIMKGHHDSLPFLDCS